MGERGGLPGDPGNEQIRTHTSALPAVLMERNNISHKNRIRIQFVCSFDDPDLRHCSLLHVQERDTHVGVGVV